MDFGNIEALIPHRGRLKLIENVLSHERTGTVTTATVGERWPLYLNGAVSTLICIELIAQSAAAHISLSRKDELDDGSSGSGWLAGLRDAVFFVDQVRPGEVIRTKVSIRETYGTYTEIYGCAMMDEKTLCEATIQIVEAQKPE